MWPFLQKWDNTGTWYSWHMGTTDQFPVRLGKRGRLVLPALLRRRLGLDAGERLLLTVDGEGGFRAISAREQARQLRGLYRHLAPGRSLADELIAERRQEARRCSPSCKANPVTRPSRSRWPRGAS